MTIKEELEMLAKDCEECGDDARREGEKGEGRAWYSVCYRIRHAAKRLDK